MENHGDDGEKKLNSWSLIIWAMERKKILFVCVENSNRSQMAEAFANIHGHRKYKSFSAGSKPSGTVNPMAIASMNQLGYDLAAHHSKSLKDIEQEAPFEVVVTMGCGDACPWIPAKKFIDWQIRDPRDMPPDRFNEVRNEIESKVKELLATL